jgi:hypothetical protein
MTLRKRIKQLMETRVGKKFTEENLDKDIDKIIKLVGELSDTTQTPEKFKEELVK